MVNTTVDYLIISEHCVCTQNSSWPSDDLVPELQEVLFCFFIWFLPKRCNSRSCLRAGQSSSPSWNNSLQPVILKSLRTQTEELQSSNININTQKKEVSLYLSQEKNLVLSNNLHPDTGEQSYAQPYMDTPCLMCQWIRTRHPSKSYGHRTEDGGRLNLAK